MIRAAKIADLDELVRLEQCFQTDRLSRRSFRYMLTKAHAVTLIEEERGEVRGYVLVLFNEGTSLARLYSIAVDERHRGKGVAQRLVTAAEDASVEQDRVYMRLEIRRDNTASIGLFRKSGYRQFGTYSDYYEDHMEALRFQKILVALRPNMAKVPYYQQTLDFTCGPAALMMAMKVLDRGIELGRSLELRLWRESTTIFMTAGHGGCGPYGLALSAYNRDFDVEIYVNDEGALFVDSVRDEEKKEVIRLVQQDFLDELASKPIAIHYHQLSLDDMISRFNAGAVPVVLISSYRIYREKFPHWVVVTGFDERFIYVHDPYVDFEKGKTDTDCMSMPILLKDFERMARYGKSGLRAALIISKRKEMAAPRVVAKGGRH